MIRTALNGNAFTFLPRFSVRLTWIIFAKKSKGKFDNYGQKLVFVGRKSIEQRFGAYQSAESWHLVLLLIKYFS